MGEGKHKIAFLLSFLKKYLVIGEDYPITIWGRGIIH
jgi:hypothetical protein